MSLAARPELGAAPSEVILGRLIRLHPKLIDLSLGRLHRLLSKLGHPERHLPPVVHVAGTNGKGSTIAFMRAALEASGAKVHVMTSPHLVRFNERIRLAGQLISDAHLIAVLTACETANDGAPVTYFEITTAAAFLAFREIDADILLLETGLGGRLDASNVIATPLLTAITAISMDHQDFLGHDLATIAFEKAGILKAGVIGIMARQAGAAARVIEQSARAVGAKLLRQDHEWWVGMRDGRLRFGAGQDELSLPAPGLLGAHQVQNAGLALACLQNLRGFTLHAADLAAGLTEAHWPGRLQRLRRGPLGAGFAGELWLDGGHNPGAGAALAATLAAWHASDVESRPLHLIVGMLKNKDVENFLAPFLPLAPLIHAVPVPYEKAAMAPERIVRTAKSMGFTVQRAASVAAAVRGISSAAATPRVLICGTLYLVGSVLATNPRDGPI